MALLALDLSDKMKLVVTEYVLELQEIGVIFQFGVELIDELS
jgi:hypothetical protein